MQSAAFGIGLFCLTASLRLSDAQPTTASAPNQVWKYIIAIHPMTAPGMHEAMCGVRRMGVCFVVLFA